MAKVLRGLVSKKKKRFTEDGFDLDLSYITPQIIAMGYPTEGREAAYRNPYKQVFAFLEKRHAGHYQVVNLCSERNRQYDAAKFNDAVLCFPFDDHHPPKFELIEEFCKAVKKYLDEDPQNVAAIHCKAGKGRTGTMIIAYMVYAQFYSDPELSKRYYALRRTYNRKGLTIPSQIRYVDYFYMSLRNRALVQSETAPVLTILSVKVVPPPLVEKLGLLRMTIHSNRQLVYEQDRPLQLDSAMLAAAARATQANVARLQTKKDKLGKKLACASCSNIYSSKDDAWLLCSMCGKDTCAECTHKLQLDVSDEGLLAGPVERLVCQVCQGKKDDAVAVVRRQQEQADERLGERPEAGSMEFALSFEPGKPVPVRGDVKVSFYHRAAKPLFHFWFHTRFHAETPIVFSKQEIDGAHKDPDCKAYPPDFRIVVDVRPAAGSEQVLPVAGSKETKKNQVVTTPSGFVVEPNGSVVFNKAVSGDIRFPPSITTGLMCNALGIVGSHAKSGKEKEYLVLTQSEANEVAASLDWSALLARLGSLNMVDLREANSAEELLGFWLNVYHLVAILGLVEQYPVTPKDRFRNSRNCQIWVAGERLSLFQIEFCILRSQVPMPAVPSALLGGSTPRRHKFSEFLENEDALNKIATFGISYFCHGTPGVKSYTIGVEGSSVADQILQNGARYLQSAGMVVHSKKQLVVVSSYLEWFQSEGDSQNLQLAVSNWLHLLGPWFDVSLLQEMKNHETYKFKFEDNVMLDEVLIVCAPEDACVEEKPSGSRAPTLPELPPLNPQETDL